MSSRKKFIFEDYKKAQVEDITEFNMITTLFYIFRMATSTSRYKLSLQVEDSFPFKWSKCFSSAKLNYFNVTSRKIQRLVNDLWNLTCNDTNFHWCNSIKVRLMDPTGIPLWILKDTFPLFPFHSVIENLIFFRFSSCYWRWLSSLNCRGHHGDECYLIFHDHKNLCFFPEGSVPMNLSKLINVIIG